MLGIIIIRCRDNKHNHPNNLNSNSNQSNNLCRNKIDMYFLRKPYKILKTINLTCSRQFKQNIKYKRYKQWRTRFLCGKHPQTCGDKKKTPQGLRPTNLNSLFKIKLHRFTLSFYPKDLLSNTDNLIHICDVAIPCCSLVDPSVPSKGLHSSTNNSNIQILE